MRIRVTREFAGRITNERRIYPGEYEKSDAALFGVGQYLLDNGFAHPVDVPPAADVPAPPPVVIDVVEFLGRTVERIAPVDTDVSGEVPEDSPTDYSDWTVKELEAEIEARGINHDSIVGTGANGNVLKEDRVRALEADDEAEG